MVRSTFLRLCSRAPRIEITRSLKKDWSASCGASGSALVLLAEPELLRGDFMIQADFRRSLADGGSLPCTNQVHNPFGSQLRMSCTISPVSTEVGVKGRNLEPGNVARAPSPVRLQAHACVSMRRPLTC